MKISVAMCTFNGAKFLKEQIDSILNQTLKVDEIIICDDGSADDTLSIVTSYHNLYPNLFKFFKNENNLRSNKNFEKAITICDGDFIFLADQDDVWNESKVENTISFFNQHTSIEGVFSNASLIDENGNLLTDSSLWDNIIYDENKLNDYTEIEKYITSAHSIVTGATFCFKKNCKEFIFPFPTIELFFHDEWISLLLSKRKTLASNPQKLISYRIHNSQQVGLNKSKTLIKKNNIVNYVFKTKSNFSFIELYKIRKNFIRVVSKFRNLEKNYSGKFIIDINEIIQKNIESIKLINNEMKKSNFILYFLCKNLNNNIKKLK